MYEINKWHRHRVVHFYGIFALVDLYQKSSFFASFTRSPSDLIHYQLVRKRYAHALSMKGTISTKLKRKTIRFLVPNAHRFFLAVRAFARRSNGIWGRECAFCNKFDNEVIRDYFQSLSGRGWRIWPKTISQSAKNSKINNLIPYQQKIIYKYFSREKSNCFRVTQLVLEKWNRKWFIVNLLKMSLLEKIKNVYLKGLWDNIPKLMYSQSDCNPICGRCTHAYWCYKKKNVRIAWKL